jgi:hypothetical protein
MCGVSFVTCVGYALLCLIRTVHKEEGTSSKGEARGVVSILKLSLAIISC